MEDLNKIDSENEDPFEEAERNFSFKLQPSLKKILLANGFDNSYVISKINESDISSTEDFARNTLPDLISESQYEEYYGIFKKNISKFKFLDGHKKQLTMVIEYYKNLYSNKFEINQTPESNHKVNKNKPSQKINISKEHKVKNKLDEKQVLNINLPEEKKIIEQNISEWINRKYNVKNNENDTDSLMYNKQDLIKNILDNQTVSVKLCNQTFNEEDHDNLEFNNVTGDITCFCGIHTKVFKRILTGRTYMTWVLSNYYRHIINHVENQGKKKLFKGSVQQTNTVKNYFTLANKGNVELTPTHESKQQSDSKQGRIKKQKKQDLNINESPSKSPNLLLASNENFEENFDIENDILKLCDDNEDDDILLDNILNDVTEVQYRKPVFTDIKTGDFLLVQFIGGNRKKTKFSYICCVNRMDENQDRCILVQGLQKENYQKTQFSIKENDLSSVTIDMILAILPEPKLIQCNRKFIYEFPGSVDVNEK